MHTLPTRIVMIVAILGCLAACSESSTEQASPDTSASPDASATQSPAPDATASEKPDAEEMADDAVEAVVDEVDQMVEQVQAQTEPVVSDLSDGEAYLFINSQKPNVQVTASGLQFEILNQGEGSSPGPTSKVVTHYHGTFVNGDVFDSSRDRGAPAEFPVNRVIKGWTEALQMMKEGDLWRLVIPPDLAYGDKGAGPIPPNSVLVFEVELIEVK